MNFKKINSRINDMFNKGEFDNDFINTKLSDDSLKKLYGYQILHVYNLISCLKKTNVIIDGSSTGTGKTYTTLCVCKELELNPIIICPKSILNIWQTACEYFDIKPLAIVNYETIKLGEIYSDDLCKRIKAPFLNLNDSSIKYEWELEKNTVIIFDEAHKCKNKNTLNGKLLLSVKNKCKIILLSATLSDTIDNFLLFGYMLDFYPTLSRGKNWIKAIIHEDQNRLIDKKISTLNKYIYPDKGSRMNIEDLGDKFPKNQITADCYMVDKADEINSYYQEIKKAYENNELVPILRARQKIELLKVQIFIEQTLKYLEYGKSVTIFVNFIETFDALSKQLKLNNIEYAKVHGKQETDRDNEIDKFMSNQVKVIICTIQTGSIGINLHDTTGRFPRVSLISPSFSSVDLIQTLGRIYRTGIQTPVLQKIIYCANTYEKIICQKVKQKLNFINYLSDEDLIHFL